ncbi:MAG: helix-turn-helix transcriptional regulator [Bacilli bacterium]|nr:helix-turn-helix transcriptional regulator [Bacilli bacterium]
MNQEKIGKFIKDLRKKNNLTQAQLAEKYGVTYQAVSKWENGKNLPDMSLIKQMSKDFNIDINDLLEGNYKTKKRNNKLIYIFIIIVIVFLITTSIILYLNRDDDFNFKTLSNNSDNFNISGSIAYNKKKSSIYITNIKYNGEIDNEKYKNIECTLYESHNNTNIKISSCNSDKEDINLKEYLNEVTIAVDNYSRVCKDYSKENLYLEINATDTNGKITTYKVPLSLDESCTN